ncbi:MAG: non-hydrolyzing UDP-N-acetylglucosamine 2-epimerase [Thermoanaerobaculia bacterium]
MKVAAVVGARPQFIKAAPVGRALREAGHREFLLHTGQHYDDAMADVFFRELEIPEPDVNLEVGSGSHGFQTGQMLMRLEEVLAAEKPDWVLVYGDTNSTLAGALAAAKLKLRLAHVEAGMRSYNREMPEEINRVISDHLSDLLFTPTQTGVENLRKEGITEGVRLVGDVMYDALRMFLPIARRRSRILEELRLEPRGYALLTAHRAETVDSDARLTRLLTRVSEVEIPVVFPAHPRTGKRMAALGLLERLPSRVRVVPPLGYLDMLRLESEARVVLTDSGGVQREAFFLSVPSVILRGETEWPELVESGASVLAGSDFDVIPVDGAQPGRRVDPEELFGRGNASQKIVKELASR